MLNNLEITIRVHIAYGISDDFSMPSRSAPVPN